MVVGTVGLALHGFVEDPAASIGSLALAAYFDFGHHLAVGLLVSALVAAWCRWRPETEWPLGWFVVAAFSVLAGALMLAPSLRGVASRAPAGWSTTAVAIGLGGVLGLAVPACGAAAERLGRTRFRAPVVMAGLALGLMNGLVLRRLYPGLHVMAAFVAATLIGGSLTTARHRWRLPKASPALIVSSLVVLATWAASSLVVRPPNDVTTRLFALPSASFAPYVAAARASLSPSHAAAFPPSLHAHGPWYRSRRNLADVPTSSLSPLPEDAIVILLVVDALRADVLSSDEHLAALPHMRKLRDEGVFFSRAWAPGPATASSVAAMFAGRHYSALRWDMKDFGKRKLVPADDPTPRFPERLSAAGVDTVEIASQRMLDNRWGLVRGFDEVRRWRRGWAKARVLASRLVARIAKHESGPLFMHTHFMDPHSPYNRAGRAGTPFERYLGEVALVDEAVGSLMQAIDDRGLADRTAVILTADHGEAFGEHNTRYHWSTLYEELVRVPLVLWLGNRPRQRIDSHVSLVDLGPTILDLYGEPAPSDYLGQSLLPLLGQPPAELSRPVAIESGRGMRARIFPDGFKIIEDVTRGVVELYDLGRDPGELHNLYDAAEPGHRKRLMQLRAFFAAHAYRSAGYERPIRP